MRIDKEALKRTFDISIETANTMMGHDDPNFRRIHHHNHHVTLYIKDYIMKEKCKYYFEIGTHFGHSLCNLLQSAYASKYVSCDLFLRGSTIANDCKIRDIESLAKKNVEKFNTNGYDCTILRGNSHSAEMLERVQREFPEGIDLLFIDGDHRRRAVIADFKSIFPWLTLADT